MMKTKNLHDLSEVLVLLQLRWKKLFRPSIYQDILVSENEKKSLLLSEDLVHMYSVDRCLHRSNIQMNPCQ